MNFFKTILTLFIVILFSNIFISCSNDDDAPLNALPTATNVSIKVEASQATGNYTYSDKEGDPEGTSTFKWYRADDINGTNAVSITNATQKVYTYTSDDDGKYIAFEVTPFQSDNTKGNPVKSNFLEYTENTGVEIGEASNDKITLYNVSGKTITKKINYTVPDNLKAFQNDDQKHQELWQQVLKIVPESDLSKINQFMIFAGDSDSSADLYGTLGYVVPTNNDLTTWQFGLAIDLSYQNSFDDHENGLKGTIVHEFGHIVTLNNYQVDPSVTSCTTHSLQEGCAKSDSYIYKFYTNYWTSIPETNTAEQNYIANPNNFVSEYGATNLGEDIAETFRIYVLAVTPTDNTFIKDKKIIELDGYLSLQNIRTSIRASIGDAAIHSKKMMQKLAKFKGCGTTIMMEKRYANQSK
ncbi:hypothetical protein ATE84_0052 [Aquimarina sp. MAR_2010_214]|uniref:hypothetical protein n=1 Tax=Aquimarina sp. MAR_2010_214 TaxID=1250026 RepID=UPI000C7097AA|nr:hypothetical protein [Aquimarina sp. MAR_2010_214]PKV48066.1 hypothetical protein ATE84_0052 [Aquimarina sp. MAR_2010_214]